MDFDDIERERRLREIWELVRIERPVHYTLFTFGESHLPYYLVCSQTEPRREVFVSKGEVRITRPSIITPGNARPEFRNFFEDPDGEGVIEFLLARTAAFSHLTFDNRCGPARAAGSSVEAVVAELNKQLDEEDEDRIAILSAPQEMAGFAVLRLAAERVLASAPGNIQELRERGFLP